MNTKIKTVLAACAAVAACASAQSAFAKETGDSQYYTDVNATSYAWAVDYVDDITRRQIAAGIGNNLFAPGSTIKRCDFMVFLDKAFSLTQSDPMAIAFSDVSENAYYAQSAINAKAANIVTDSSLYPDLPITRQDAMLYIYRAMNAKNYVGNNASSDLSAFSDASEIKAGEPEIAVATLANIGIVSGDNGKIKPKDTMTRAEMAVVFSKTAEYIDDIEADKRSAAEKATEVTTAQINEDEGNIEGGSVSKAVKAVGKDYTITDATINIPNQSAPAVSVKGGSLTVTDSSIISSGYSGIELDDSSKADLNDSSVKVSGAAALKVSGNSDADIDGGTYQEDGDIVTGGLIRVLEGSADFLNANIKSSSSAAVNVLNGSDLTIGRGSYITSESEDGTIKISSVDGDNFVNSDQNEKGATVNIVEATAENTAKGGSLFVLEDANATINIRESKVSADKLFEIYSQNHFKSSGNKVVLNLEDQELEGVVEANNLTAIDIFVGDNSTFRGTVNENNESDSVNITINESAQVEFTGTCCFNEFVIAGEDTTMNNIFGNGNTIYYDASEEANRYLDNKTYSLVNGGQLVPY